MTLISSCSPMLVGATLPAYSFYFVDDENKVVPITGATLYLYFYDPETDQYTLGQGAFNVTNGPLGIATYAWNAADTAQSFDGYLSVDIVLSGGGIYIPDPVPFKIKPRFFLAAQRGNFV